MVVLSIECIARFRNNFFSTVLFDNNARDSQRTCDRVVSPSFFFSFFLATVHVGKEFT